MSFTHGTDAKLYYAMVDFTSYLESIDPTFNRPASEIKALGAGWVQQVQGARAFTLEMAGLFDATIEDTAWDAFNDGAEHYFAYLPQGDGNGVSAYCGKSDLGSISIPIGDEAVKMPISAIGCRLVDKVRILQPLATISGVTTTAGHNNLASSSNGLRAYLICTEITGIGAEIDVHLEDSANGTDWQDISFAEFQTVVGPALAEEMIETVGTVRQYVRAVSTPSGGGSAKCFVAFARK